MPKTNFEKIKEMSIDEMAQFLTRVNCAYAEDCMVGASNCKHPEIGCSVCFKEYLESKVNNDD